MARAIVVKKASRTATGKPVASPVGKAKPKARKPSKRAAAQVGRHDAAGRHDGQGKPREGQGRGRAGFCLYPQPAAAATRHRRTRRCPGGQDAAGLEALREVGNGVVWRRRRLVLLLRRLRRPRQAHVRARHLTQARATGDADRDGQGLAGRGPRIGGRPRRTPGRVVDETSHGHPRLRGEEAMSPDECRRVPVDRR